MSNSLKALAFTKLGTVTAIGSYLLSVMLNDADVMILYSVEWNGGMEWWNGLLEWE